MHVRWFVGLLVVALASGMSVSPAGAAVRLGDPPTAMDIVQGDHVDGGLSALTRDDNVFHRVRATTGASPTVRYIADFTVPSERASEISVKVTTTRSCQATASRWNFDTRSWEATNRITVTPEDETPMHISALPGTTVSPNGTVRIRFNCTRSGDRFMLKTDVLVSGPDPG